MAQRAKFPDEPNGMNFDATDFYACEARRCHANLYGWHAGRCLLYYCSSWQIIMLILASSFFWIRQFFDGIPDKSPIPPGAQIFYSNSRSSRSDGQKFFSWPVTAALRLHCYWWGGVKGAPSIVKKWNGIEHLRKVALPHVEQKYSFNPNENKERIRSLRDFV